MISKPKMDELLVLIKLLKAEGIKEYRDSELSIHLYPQKHSSFGGPIQLGSEEGSSEAEEGDPDSALAEVELPDALRKLNSNYLKLTGIVPNSSRAK